jgi:acyl-CoA synthetase (AMP-forming)/AMP-acid ligase II
LIWRITAADSERDQRRAAAALRRAGLREGDRVALIQPNSPLLLATILGALRTGVVPVLLHPGLLPAERQALLDDAEPAAVFDDQARLPSGDDEVDLRPVPRARPMHYTSGTSGRPKGVWTGVLSDDNADALFRDEVGPWRFDRADTTYIGSPLYHSAAVRFSAMTLLSGGDVLLADKFDAAEAAAAFAAERPTAAFVVPAHLQRLFGLNEQVLTHSFRLLIHAGAPCPPALKQRAMEAFPPGSVWEFYGSTEGQFTICSPDGWLAHPGSVGQARAQRTIEIDDDGQVWCHAPPFARFEYWRDQEKTAAAWRDGAFSVGDIGHLDDDGFLYLDGRRDDLVISGGVNVYPAEVERAIAAMPGVHEVAVFGAPDDRWGQRVCVAVIAEPDITAADVERHARAHLAAYKCPKDVYLVDDLPRTITGKVRRTAVLDHLALG